MNAMTAFWLTTQRQMLFCFVTAFFLILFTAWFGILTRPLAHSAFFWPANAVLLGLLIKSQLHRRPATLFGAAIGFIVADLSTGNYFLLSCALTLANFVSVYASFFCFQWLRQKHQHDSFYMRSTYPYFMATLIGSGFCAVFAVMVLPHIPHTFVSSRQHFIDFIGWWSGEMFNYVIVLPLVLTAPTWQFLRAKYWKQKPQFKLQQLKDLAPFVAVILSCVITHYFFAPGAMLYPLAMMMWAATVYSLFRTALISALVCLTLFHSLSYIYFQSAQNDILYPMISIRIGLSILAITTLFIGMMSLNRRKIFEEMAYLADHDSLTETLNRRSFMRLAEHVTQHHRHYPIAILMLDLDHFKKINDQYGHHAGDVALKHFSKLVRQNLRESDAFCRMGGEEFVILLKNTDMQIVETIAERIRMELAQSEIHLDDQQILKMTVSIGVYYQQQHQRAAVDLLIKKADEALYTAKHAGRNQIQLDCAN